MLEVKHNVILNFKLSELRASFHVLRFSLYFHSFVVFPIPGVAFVKFILKCFILFDAIVNVVLWISFLDCLLLISRYYNWLFYIDCISWKCSAHVLVLIGLCVRVWIPQDFLRTVKSPARESCFFLCSLDSFHLFVLSSSSGCSLRAEPERTGEKRHPLFVPDLRGRAFCLFPQSVTVAGLFVVAA